VESRDDSAEDARLAKRIADGDASAEGELCRRLFPRIRAYGRRHLRDEASSADLAQAVLVVVLEALRERRVTELDRLPAFVMGAARNTVFEWKRGQRTRRTLLERFGPAFADVAHPVEPIDDRRLTTCLERLPPRERTILVMTFYAERAGEEIARELGTTLGNVRIARHRALKQLHGCMTEGP
jgi:RNA polymerase sigma-70 factor (ECF subfamily)